MSLRLAFAVTETGPEAAAGDYFTALELGAALEARFGWQIEYRPKGEAWYELGGVDVLVVMVDDYALPAVRQAPLYLITIAWARNWFERWCGNPWAAHFRLHLASARRAADFMSQQTGKRARLLRIATNPERFNTDGRPARPTLDYVFTGHYWQAERDVVDVLSALPTRYRGAIYGKNWEQVPALAQLHRGFVPYGQIAEVYRQAAIVIDDANHVTKAWGAANSRVFDALAAGCLVITNAQSVSDEVFGGRLPVYNSPDHLRNLLDHYLADVPARQRLVDDLRAEVLAKHTYRHRAWELARHLDTLGAFAGIGGLAKTSRRQAHEHSEALPSPPALAHAQTLADPAQALNNAWPSVSFVVPLFNQLAATRAMLASLLNTLPAGLRYQTILADDASTDGTPAWLATLKHPHIHVLYSQHNKGFAATNHHAIAHASGEVLCLINNDLIFSPGWLEPMLSALLSPSLNAGLVGNLQYRVADGALDHAGVCLNTRGQFEHIRTLPSGAGQLSRANAVTGACMLLRRADFDAVGGFDEHYLNGCEDIDLCFKIRGLQKHIYVANNSRIQHHVSLSRKANTSQDWRNSRYLFQRWRQAIKRDLSALWLQALQAGLAAYAECVDGSLAPQFVSKPHSAAQIMAEAMLCRQEAFWAQQLDEPATTASWAKQVQAQGLRFDTQHRAQVLNDCATFSVQGLAHARNFYVCGRLLGDAAQPLALQISVNGLQTVHRSSQGQASVNLGLLYPLVLPNAVNTFQVQTNRPLVLTHLVLDDQVIAL